MKRFSIQFIIVVIVISLLFSCDFIYYSEYNSIKRKLQENDKIEIVKLYGNEDVTFEEICAVLKVKNKGLLSIYGLSKDVNSFPENVYLIGIGKYSFVNFICNGGMTWNLNIGLNSDFGIKTKIKFESVDDIVNHYDDIIKYVETFKVFPESNRYEIPNYGETILFVESDQEMNKKNLMKYYNSECVADLQNEINKTWNKNCR